MYQNCIRRPYANQNPQSYIRHADIAYDERIAFIESVCRALVESRFGPGYVFQPMADPSGRQELEPAVFYDLPDNVKMPRYALSPLGREWRQMVEAAFQEAKQMRLAAPRPNRSNSTAVHASNLGRGSPGTVRTACVSGRPDL